MTELSSFAASSTRRRFGDRFLPRRASLISALLGSFFTGTDMMMVGLRYSCNCCCSCCYCCYCCCCLNAALVVRKQQMDKRFVLLQSSRSAESNGMSQSCTRRHVVRARCTTSTDDFLNSSFHFFFAARDAHWGPMPMCIAEEAGLTRLKIESTAFTRLVSTSAMHY